MDIIKIVAENLSQNSYLIVENETAILVDAGAFVGQIEENLKVFFPKPKLKAVFLTHCHFDHIAELDNIVKKYRCPVYIYKDGKPMLFDEKKNLSYLDEPFKIKTEKSNINTFLDEDKIVIDDIEVVCYNTPGHSIDSSCFVIGDNMFTGDTIFKVGVGRTDMFSGDENVQRISLLRLRDVISEGINHFYAGHGANFGTEELKYNIERTIEE